MKTIRYKSAGGVIIADGKMLLLDRPSRNEVRLPKGHIEAGETIEAAAVREVIEETGYADPVIVADLGEQVVEFDYKGKHYVRTEYYYLMHLTSDRQIARNPQDAADFCIRWSPLASAMDELTYAAEQAVAQKAARAHQNLPQ